MNPVAGFESCDKLCKELRARFGRDIIVDSIEQTQDAFGWKLASRSRLLFSTSTYGGGLPAGMFDFQVSIIDDTLENGEILFGPDSPLLSVKQVCDIVAQYQSGELPNR
jgi:hypothetical protein